MDRDLQSIQEVRDLVRQAKEAQHILARMSQGELDRLTQAISQVGQEHARQLGRMAAEETGFGVAGHKALKNEFAAKTVYEAIRNQKTVGILAEDPAKQTIDIGVPVGVVAALVPSTNPTSTVIYKAMISLKAGNPVIFSPHPGALNCILETVGLVARAVEQAGAPRGAVSAITTPTLEATNALMRHPDTRMILATGGMAMVKAAYSSGTPAIGVGAGNGPAYIHHSADVKEAVRRIFDSKTFDNGTICASEQSIVLCRAMEDTVRRELTAQGGWILNPEEKEKLASFILRPNGTMNPAIVGKSAETLAELAGLGTPPAGTRVLIVPEDQVGDKHPFSHEKLAPILALYVEADEEAALARCVQILDFEGAGHSFLIHAKDRAAVERFALAVPASRIVVNSPGALGGIGATTNLFPAMTLGCGAVGGSSSSNNIGPLDLINIKRVAWGVRERSDLGGMDSSQFTVDEDKLRAVVEQVLRRMV
ncbi:MAG: acetaldehyde dehydrogenase (acetylating) [Oscillospiraceae bacterium]|nr:acetaldehyde dehydrogenase (acetylating) [Oscillospiraceae bacterium]